MKRGGDLSDLKPAELDTYFIFALLESGILPMKWHEDYKNNPNRQLTWTHKIDISRMRGWRNEGASKK